MTLGHELTDPAHHEVPPSNRVRKANATTIQPLGTQVRGVKNR